MVYMRTTQTHTCIQTYTQSHTIYLDTYGHTTAEGAIHGKS